MKIFITGVNGQLGFDVARNALIKGHEVITSDIQDTLNSKLNVNYHKLDITDKESVIKTIVELSPEVVVHCAAWTAVDLAEKEENKDKVYSINQLGTKYIAETCKEVKAKMVYFSTDYVFSGEGETPWSTDTKEYNPLNVYGDSKLQGENEVQSILDEYFIIRIAWVFGINGNNFVKTMLKLADNHKELRVVCDQIGTPTSTYDLSNLVLSMIETNKYGIYHATNEGGYISWYDFANEIFIQANKDVKVIPVTTKEYGISIAKRPFNSRLNKNKLVEYGFELLPDWKDALHRYLIELGIINNK